MPRILSSPSARKRKKKMETRKVTEEGEKKKENESADDVKKKRKIKAFLATEKIDGICIYLYIRTYICLYI